MQTVNRKLTAMNKLLMEENDRLQKQVSQLVYENSYFRQQTQNVSIHLQGLHIQKNKKKTLILVDFLIQDGEDDKKNPNFHLKFFVDFLIYLVKFFQYDFLRFSSFFPVLQTNLATTDTSCESVVTSGQHHLTPQHPPRDASPAGSVNKLEI